jgi:predicted Zn-dependent protease
MRKTTIPLLLLALTLLTGCATVPLTGRSQLAIVPQAEMTAVGIDGYKSLIEESKLSSDAKATGMVRRVGTRIATSAEQFLTEHGLEQELRYYEWEFNLIDADSTVNAFCMPGGKVGVYTGILPVTQDETGLAVVVGHEVAHAIAKHGGERMSQLLLYELGGMALSAAMQKKPEETQELVMLAYGIGGGLGVLLPYSRRHESEADRIGLILMARAGYDPNEAVPFWSRMSDQGGPRPPEFLSTHPDPQRRIREIRSYIPEALNYYYP